MNEKSIPYFPNVLRTEIGNENEIKIRFETMLRIWNNGTEKFYDVICKYEHIFEELDYNYNKLALLFEKFYYDCWVKIHNTDTKKFIKNPSKIQLKEIDRLCLNDPTITKEI